MPRRRKNQAHLNVGGDLFEVGRSKVAAVVGIQNLGNAEDDPVGPDFLQIAWRRASAVCSADGLLNDKKNPAMARL
jgi:hypothetical protein